jgi:hypothetical protein
LWEEIRAWFDKKTLRAWCERNPRLVKRPKTRFAFVLSDDLIDLISNWEEPPR